MALTLSFQKKAKKLESSSFDIDATKFYIPDFLAAQAITMIYSPPNHGKTWLNFAIAAKLAKEDQSLKVFYFDLDNGIRTLKQRGIEQHLEMIPNWEYYISSSLEMSTDELLESLNKDAYASRYKDVILIFDSTRDFIPDLSNDRRVKYFMGIMKRIRDNGGTVILIHHTTKNGKVIDGSADFEKSADNIFFLTQKSRSEEIIQYMLHVKKERDPIVDCGFSVCTNTLEIGELDPVLAGMSLAEEEFVKKAKEVIKTHPDGISQTNLLENLGYRKDDKTARNILDKFGEQFWKRVSGGKGKPVCYHSINTQI